MKNYNNMYFISSDHQKGHEKHQGEIHQIIQLHGSLMIAAWFIIAQIGIWSQYFKHNRYSNYLHIVCMSTVYLLSIFASSLMIGLKGFSVIGKNFWHQALGSILLFGLIPVTILIGLVSKIMLSLNTLNSKLIVMKKIHRFFGWASIILIKIPLLSILFSDEGFLAVFIVFFQIFSYSLFFYLQSTSIKMQKSLVACPSSGYHLQLSAYRQYINLFQGTSFIFSNLVFILDRVKNHPGGQHLIELCRDQEVDRYIYGIEGPESLYTGQKKGYTHSHTSNCFRLAQNLVAKIFIDEPFRILKQVNQCQKIVMLRDKSQKMYIVYLKCKLEEKLQGYTSTNQLGRFKALRIGQKTRLYSNVQFLRYENIKKLEKLQKINIQTYQKCKKPTSLQVKSSTSIELQQNLLFGQDSFDYIPFFIKTYTNGQFTDNIKHLLENSRQGVPIMVSESRGFGLALQYFQSSRQLPLILFAGGTGLNVYCDLIDLLFKQMRLKKKCSEYQQFEKKNPILKEGLLKKFRYTLYIAVDQIDEIHPITLYQCIQLAKENLLEFHVKEKNRNHSQKRFLSYDECKGRFQEYIERKIEKDRQSIFFACGPPKMMKKIKDKLQELHIPKNKYRLI